MNDLSPAEPAVAPTEALERPPRRRRWFAGGLLGLTLCAVLLGGTAFAQSDSKGTSLRDTFTQRLAEKLGLSAGELETAIDETTNEMIDEAVAEGRLSEEHAERLREQLESGDGFFRMMPERPALGMRHFGLMGAERETIADELEMSTDELRAKLESGATLEEIITAHGSTVEAVVSALMADATAELNEAVENGNLSQEDADRMIKRMSDQLTRMIESGMSGECDRWFGGDTDESQESEGVEETSNQV